MPLSEADICATALRLIDAEGVEALSMRKLAAELNANPMSLYHHVPNKDAVLRGVAALVGAEFRTTTAEDLPWQDRLRRLANDFRALAHRHPTLMAYSFRQPDFIQPEEPFWAGLTEILDGAGVPGRSIPQLRCLVCAIVVGVLHAELNGALRQWTVLAPTFGEDTPTADVDHLWERTLDAVIAVVRRELADGDDPR